MAWPKKSILPKTPPAPDADTNATTPAKASPASKSDKPVSYKRGKYSKSGKVSARENFAKVLNANKSTKLP